MVARPRWERSPCTDGRMLAPSRPLLLAGALAFLLLAVAASANGGSLLLLIDEPVQEAIVSNRHPVLDQFFGVATHLGASSLVIPAAVALVVSVWRRCTALALSILAAVTVRPVLETGFKLVVGRTRPELAPLIDLSTASFPSGHVFTAVAVWGLLPFVAGVLGWSRVARRAVLGVVAGVAVLVAASRVYLGVHWLTDVVGGAIIGVLFVVAVDVFLDRLHRRRHCSSDVEFTAAAEPRSPRSADRRWVLRRNAARWTPSPRQRPRAANSPDAGHTEFGHPVPDEECETDLASQEPKDVEVSEIEVPGDRATAVTDSFTFRLVQDDGKWLIDGGT